MSKNKPSRMDKEKYDKFVKWIEDDFTESVENEYKELCDKCEDLSKYNDSIDNEVDKQLELYEEYAHSDRLKFFNADMLIILKVANNLRSAYKEKEDWLRLKALFNVMDRKLVNLDCGRFLDAMYDILIPDSKEE